MSSSAWQSLAGYLVLKPTGALGKLLSKKRYWYVLDERTCHLLYFRSEAESQTKSALGGIAIRHAAISVKLETPNQFVIHSEGKDYELIAENHESMMVWVLALQARREARRDPRVKSVILGDDHSNRRESLPSDQEMKIMQDTAKSAECGTRLLRTLSVQHSHFYPKNVFLMDLLDSSSIGEEPDASRERKMPAIRKERSVSYPSAKKPDANNNGFTRPSSSPHSCYESDESGTLESPMASPRNRIRLLRQLNTEEKSHATSENQPTIEEKDHAGSVSGNSVSSDSAVGHSECAHSLRLLELETELMLVKCDLAKVLNRESTYKNQLALREQTLSKLESQLLLKQNNDHTQVSTESVNPPKNEPPNTILQNHNRFLNEEVLKLSRMLQKETYRNKASQMQTDEMASLLEQFKRDYVFLMQSCIRISNREGPEQIEMYLYGGNRHKQRVIALLEEARQSNPALPVYEGSETALCHVDSFGFRHCYKEEGAILHYICRQLYLHYNMHVHIYDQHVHRWREYLKSPDIHSKKELQSLVRGGIPENLRSKIWCILYRRQVQDLMAAKGSHYYNNLCMIAPDSQMVSTYKRQISLDLLRTMPNNIRFSDQNSDGVRKMQEVLQAFCLHNPSLGYCQGMNFLTAICLLFFEPEDTFWCLVAVVERYFPAGYFDQSLIGAQADQEVLRELVKEKLPALAQHLSKFEIELCTITLNWFLGIFFDIVPIETLMRIWDCFLLEGPKVLFRFALAVLKMHEPTILAKSDSVSVMKELKTAARLCFDVDALFKVAFEEFSPFPRRNSLAAKQAYYFKLIQGRTRRQNVDLHLLENVDEDSINGDELFLESAVVYDKDKIWLCHGNQNGAQISKVNCEENIMYRVNLMFDSRVTCLHTLDDETVLLGTLSHYVHAYNTRSRKLRWEVRVNDSVMSLCSFEEDGRKTVFSGLADGTVAVIENTQGVNPKLDTIYVMIGSNPVSCLSLLEERLWCACGNRVVILSARTLDSVDIFQTSTSGMDYISLLAPGQTGVWIAMRGSSLLQLWDSQTLTCRMLYDIQNSRYPKYPKENESCVSEYRITSLLPLESSILVGTAEGSLFIYNTTVQLSRCSSASEKGFACFVESCMDNELLNQNVEHQQKDEDNFEDVTLSLTRERVDSGCYSSAISRRDSCVATIESLTEEHLQDRQGSSSHSVETVISFKTSTADDGCQLQNGGDPVVIATNEDGCIIKKREDSFNSDDTTLCASPRDSWNVLLSRKHRNSVNSRRRHSKKNCLLHANSVSLSNLSASCTKCGCIDLKMGYTMSADDIRRWASGETLSSSATSDSYEFDDLFVAYTEDDVFKQDEKELKLYSEFIQKMNSCDATDTIFDFAKSKEKLDVGASQKSAWQNDSWTSLDDAKDGYSTNGGYSNGKDSGTTPVPGGNDNCLLAAENGTQKGSDTASNISFNSVDMAYTAELQLQEKIKVSDKPIRCLLKATCSGILTVVSCAGSYGDDEAILLWTKEGKEQMWTNDPVIEVCPYTNTIKPSLYTRSRLPRRTSVAGQQVLPK